MTGYRPRFDPSILALASSPWENELRPLLLGTFSSCQYQYDAQGQNGTLTPLVMELDAEQNFVISVHAGPGQVGHLTVPLRGNYRLDGELLRLMPERNGSHMLYQITSAGTWGFRVQWCYADINVEWRRVQPRRLAHI